LEFDVALAAVDAPSAKLAAALAVWLALADAPALALLLVPADPLAPAEPPAPALPLVLPSPGALAAPLAAALPAAAAEPEAVAELVALAEVDAPADAPEVALADSVGVGALAVAEADELNVGLTDGALADAENENFGGLGNAGATFGHIHAGGMNGTNRHCGPQGEFSIMSMPCVSRSLFARIANKLASDGSPGIPPIMLPNCLDFM
jgi:hypothetical protein